MHRNLSFPKDIEDGIERYRRQRREETGKKMFRMTAIVELLQQAVTNVQPERPITDRLADLEQRIERLEQLDTLV